MRSENMVKYQDFSASPRSAIYKRKKQNKILRAVGSVCKPAGILNRSAGSGAMQAWHQDNFVGVLNRPAGSEAMSGK
jgi:hypothetical protein